MGAKNKEGSKMKEVDIFQDLTRNMEKDNGVALGVNSGLAGSCGACEALIGGPTR